MEGVSVLVRFIREAESGGFWIDEHRMPLEEVLKIEKHRLASVVMPVGKFQLILEEARNGLQG